MTQTLFSQKIVDAICSVVGSGPVGLHEPSFAGNEWSYVKECLDSTFVSSVGKFVEIFEASLVGFTGARHAVAVVNGTAALHIALKLVGVKPNDEVLIPALTLQSAIKTSENPYGDGCASKKIVKVLKTTQLDNILKKDFFDIKFSL